MNANRNIIIAIIMIAVAVIAIVIVWYWTSRQSEVFEQPFVLPPAVPVSEEQKTVVQEESDTSAAINSSLDELNNIGDLDAEFKDVDAELQNL